MRRPFLNAGIAELEAAFETRGNDPVFLRELLAELEFRKVPRAVQLREKARRRLAAMQQVAREKPAAAPPAPRPEPPRVAGPPPAPPPPLPAATFGPSPPGDPEGVIDAWTALEVLSPKTFVQPHDLAARRDKRAVAKLDGTYLPWERGGERSLPERKLYYQVVLGSIDMRKAVPRVLSVFQDTRVERLTPKGHAPLAIVILDRTGRPVGPPAVHLASFGWGVPRALRNELAQLAGWTAAEPPIVEGLEKQLRRMDADGELIPLGRADLDRAYGWLVQVLGVPADLVTAPAFAIRSYEYFKNPEPPEPLLLNSFFLRDLALVRGAFATGRPPRLLRQYLGLERPRTRPDLLEDTGALESAVAPGLTPPACWPGPGRHPLVLLQQAAVNLAIHEVRDGGILAVNGPPGTGKTTLLRDLVAAIVTQRAEAMTAFDDPAAAFLKTGVTRRSGGAWQHLYRLDPNLRGFEIVVASSNNKAVENVSAELPGMRAVAEDAAGLRYFKPLSDALREQETWGLIAAVLGNAANRARFRQTFWWDKEAGLRTYLLEAAGRRQVVQPADSAAGAPERQPRIVVAENPPRGHTQALARWQAARIAFRNALQRSRAHLEQLARVRELALALPALAAVEAQAGEDLAAAQEAERAAVSRAGDANGVAIRARHALSVAEAALAEHDHGRPGFFARLFRTRAARDWQAARASLAQVRDQARTSAGDAVRARSAAEAARGLAGAALVETRRGLLDAAARHAAARREVDAARERLGGAFADAAFFQQAHEDLQKATPWLDAPGQRLRDDVFVAAMRLHRAFIDAAARPLRHNLGVLMDVFGGQALAAEAQQALLPDLWSSLFLVVPLVSTTFASVERMLGDLPAETFGWLLVDEAGQALPQAAAGALLRARRAVVVGDPIQIEPVVSLPDTLTEAVCRHFGADPNRFNAPAASVQTLADAATPYGAEIETGPGTRSVGVPLLVHRRCADPMFAISNAVAYEGLMVQAKSPAPSAIGTVLGPSRWIHVEGSAEEKWSPEEGDAVRELLVQLKEAGVTPDLYIVTPFVVVADHLRKMIGDARLLDGWTDDPRAWISQRIGTVHTVQGREAEAVVFVLGAPAQDQTGARGWAGSRPNLLNVAVTRAKERLYVVGNRRLWRGAGVFRELDARLASET